MLTACQMAQKGACYKFLFVAQGLFNEHGYRLSQAI